MQHVRGWVIENLVYVLFWNLKCGLRGKKKNKPVLKCQIYLWLYQLPLSSGQPVLHCTTNQTKEKPYCFPLQAASSKISISATWHQVSRSWTSHTHPKTKDNVLEYHLRHEASPASNRLSAFSPKSQEPDSPRLIYSCWLFCSDWNYSNCSRKVWDPSSCPPAQILQDVLLWLQESYHVSKVSGTPDCQQGIFNSFLVTLLYGPCQFSSGKLKL